MQLVTPRALALAGGVAGLLVGGLWGALLGLALGALLDYARLLAPFLDSRWPGPPGDSQRRFLISTFAVMGHLAKVDGRISEQEIEAARAIMHELGLDAARRRHAIALFTAGKRPGFPLRTVVWRLRRRCRRAEQRERFLAFQVRLALADGTPGALQQQALQRVCRGLRLDPLRLEQLLRRQRNAREGGYSPQAVKRSLQNAYELLGVAESATDEDVKRAYRRAISRHHPDRVVAQGLGEGEVQAAAKRTHAIRSAFEEIRRVRNI